MHLEIIYIMSNYVIVSIPDLSVEHKAVVSIVHYVVK